MPRRDLERAAGAFCRLLGPGLGGRQGFGEPPQGPSDVEALPSTIAKAVGLMVFVADLDVYGGTTNGEDVNRAFPRAARATRVRQSRADCRGR
jgi:hypothetical protein